MKELPKNIQETVDYIDNLNIQDINYYLENKNEKDFLIKIYWGFGMYIRNSLGLWSEKSEIREWFKNNYFLEHPDDISHLILIYYYRVKNKKDTNLSDELNIIYKHWIEFDPDFYRKLKKFKLDKINEKINSNGE